MKRGAILCFAIVFWTALPATARGGANSGEFLRIGSGARVPAMGDAGTAFASGAAALHYNPSALSSLKRSELEFMFNRYALDIGHGSLAYVRPLSDESGWGVSLSYLDYGSSSRTYLNVAGGAVTSTASGAFSGHDISIGVSYGRRWREISIGGTAKVISSEIDNSSAEAFAIDLGMSWKSATSPLEVGVVMKNLGTELKYDVTSEKLPILLRAGASYALYGERLRLSTEYEAVQHGKGSFMTGAEFWVVNEFALRIGYDGRGDALSGITAGAGFKWNDLTIDYAYLPYEDVGDNHRISLNYAFGTAGASTAAAASASSATASIMPEAPASQPAVASAPSAPSAATPVTDEKTILIPDAPPPRVENRASRPATVSPDRASTSDDEIPQPRRPRPLRQRL